jgi:hypothetical protein
MAAEYAAIAYDLPPVYQDDVASFAQLDGYLSLVDEVLRSYAERLAELPAWLSPAASVWPPGVAADAGWAEVRAALVELYDALGEWFAYRFPGSWRTDAAGLRRRREFVARAARIWRRRGTPRGFLDWFCLYFGIAAADRPLLFEHFKYGAEAGHPLPWLRATLLVPTAVQFQEYARRAEAAAFVSRYAPSHVLMRLCWTAPGFAPPAVPAPGAGAAALNAYRAAVRALLCELVDDVPHGVAIHLGECADEGGPRDRLDVGRLPTRDIEP